MFGLIVMLITRKFPKKLVIGLQKAVIIAYRVFVAVKLPISASTTVHVSYHELLANHELIIN